MNEEAVPVAPGPSDGHLSSAQYCYRCGSMLDKDPTWCGSCGATQITTCRKCGLSFRKEEGRCPGCGTRRVRKRRRRRSLKVFLRESAAVWLEEHRRMILFTLAGFAAGITLGAVLKALSEKAMPNGGTADVTSLRYWVDPFIAAGRVVGHAVARGVSSALGWLYNLVISHFKTSVLGFLGAVTGLLVAIRRERRRHRSGRHY